MGQLSNITTRGRHQTVMKEREIKKSKGGKDYNSLNRVSDSYQLQ